MSFLPMEDIGEDGTIRLGRTRPVAEVRNGYTYFEDGDVAFAKVTPCFENGKGALMRDLEGGAGFGTSELTVLRPKRETSARFLNYAVQTVPFRKLGAAAMTGAGGLKRVPDEFTRNFRIPFPPLAEQQRIANFLDEKTARIDALIAEKETLVQLLAEYAEAAITRAILGADHVVRTQVNVPEIASIPRSWRLVPMMRLTAPDRPIMYGIVLPGPNVEGGPSVPIVKGGDVRPHRLRLDLLNRTTPEIEAPYARARLRELDIVYSIRGTIGDAELVPVELEGANITQDVARISPAAEIEPRWLLYAAKSRPVFAQLEQLSLGAAVRGINIFDLKRARVPTPSRPEQVKIAGDLDVLIGRLEALRRHSTAHVERLREYRSSLISAAVTGQLNIDDFQARQLEAA